MTTPVTSVSNTSDKDEPILAEGIDLLRARYRDDTISAPDQWNSVLSTLLSHRSVRAFLPTPVPAAIVETAIAAAQSAASSQNLQMWSVVAVEDPDRRGRLAEWSANQKFIREAPLFLIWLVDLSRLEFISRDQNGAAEALTHLEPFIISIIDAALAAQNAVVAFESLGLGTVYVGAVRYSPLEVISELNLPPFVLPIFGLSVGYPDPTSTTDVKPRLSQSVVLHRERYTSDHQRNGIADYDVKMRQFQNEQGMEIVDWSENSIKRVQRLHEMVTGARYREALHSLGFAR